MRLDTLCPDNSRYYRLDSDGTVIRTRSTDRWVYSFAVSRAKHHIYSSAMVTEEIWTAKSFLTRKSDKSYEFNLFRVKKHHQIRNATPSIANLYGRYNFTDVSCDGTRLFASLFGLPFPYARIDYYVVSVTLSPGLSSSRHELIRCEFLFNKLVFHSSNSMRNFKVTFTRLIDRPAWHTTQ